MNELVRIYTSLNPAHTFCLLQHQVSACTLPHSTLHRYCTSTLANVHTNASWQDLVFAFQYYFLCIQIVHYFPEKLDYQFQKKSACYLSLIHNSKICTNIFKHFIYVSAFKIQQNLFLTSLIIFPQKQKLRLI